MNLNSGLSSNCASVIAMDKLGKRLPRRLCAGVGVLLFALAAAIAIALPLQSQAASKPVTITLELVNPYSDAPADQGMFTYGIYTSATAAKANSGALAEIALGSNTSWFSESDVFAVGTTYYFRSIATPGGFITDNTIYDLTPSVSDDGGIAKLYITVTPPPTIETPSQSFVYSGSSMLVNNPNYDPTFGDNPADLAEDTANDYKSRSKYIVPGLDYHNTTGGEEAWEYRALSATVWLAGLPTNAGKYEIRLNTAPVYEHGSRYEEIAAATSNVVQIEIVRADAQLEVSQSDWTYGETLIAPDFVTITGGVATVEYKEHREDNGAFTIEAPTEAGQYDVRVTIAETANYLEQAAVANFCIQPALPALSVAQCGWSFGEAAIAPDFLNVSGGDATIEYKSCYDTDSAYTSAVPTAAGEYKVKVSLGSTDNYRAIFATADFVIAKATPTLNVELASWVYGNKPSLPQYQNISAGAVSIDYINTFIAGSSYTTQVPNTCGYYCVRVRIFETANYVAVEAYADFMIAPTDKAPQAFTVTQANWVYGDKATAPVFANFTGGTETVEYKSVEADNSEYTTEVPTKAGIYTVRVTLGQTNDYLPQRATDDFIITKRPISFAVYEDSYVAQSIPNTPTYTNPSGGAEDIYYASVNNPSLYAANLNIAGPATYLQKELDADNVSVAPPRSTGDYAVFVQIAETENYKSCVDAAVFKVAADTLGVQPTKKSSIPKFAADPMVGLAGTSGLLGAGVQMPQFIRHNSALPAQAQTVNIADSATPLGASTVDADLVPLATIGAIVIALLALLAAVCLVARIKISSISKVTIGKAGSTTANTLLALALIVGLVPLSSMFSSSVAYADEATTYNAQTATLDELRADYYTHLQSATISPDDYLINKVSFEATAPANAGAQQGVVALHDLNGLKLASYSGHGNVISDEAPQAGALSTRSILHQVASDGSSFTYDAVFYFDIDNYPEIAFYAISTTFVFVIDDGSAKDELKDEFSFEVTGRSGDGLYGGQITGKTYDVYNFGSDKELPINLSAFAIGSLDLKNGDKSVSSVATKTAYNTVGETTQYDVKFYFGNSKDSYLKTTVVSKIKSAAPAPMKKTTLIPFDTATSVKLSNNTGTAKFIATEHASGNGYITVTYTLTVDGTAHDYKTKVSVHCISGQTVCGPNSGSSSSYTIYLDSTSEANGKLTVNLSVIWRGPTQKALWSSLDGYWSAGAIVKKQDESGKWKKTFDLLVPVTIRKASADPNTNHTSATGTPYALKGAKFEIASKKSGYTLTDYRAKNKEYDANHIQTITANNTSAKKQSYGAKGVFAYAQSDNKLVKGKKYYWREVAAPEGYELDSSWHDFVAGDDDWQELTMVNKPEKGQIEIKKVSSNPAVSYGHPLYSLKGATFGIYNNLAAARVAARTGVAGSTGLVAKVVANEAGEGGSYKAIVPDIYYGVYYVVELSAPDGFKRRLGYQPVKLSTEYPSQSVEIANEPLLDPLQALVQKLDVTNDNKPYGQDDPSGKTLAGGEFTVRYYPLDATQASYGLDSLSNEEIALKLESLKGSLPLEHLREWVLLTDDYGKVDLRNSQAKAGSSAFYYGSDNRREVPAGIFTAQETKAPSGYYLPEPNPISVLRVRWDKDTEDTVEEIKNPATGKWERFKGTVYQGNVANEAITVLEQPRQARVIKRDADIVNPDPSKYAAELINDTEFTLYQESYKGAGDWTEITRHVTGTQRLDSTKPASLTDGIVLYSPVPLGSYKVVETRPNPAFQSGAQAGVVQEQLFEINEDSKDNIELVFADYRLEPIVAHKKDKATNKPIENTEFKLFVHSGTVIKDGYVATDVSSINEDDALWQPVSDVYAYDQKRNVVTRDPYNINHEPIKDTLVTDNDGKAVFAALPFGYYKLVETRPNPSYKDLASTYGTNAKMFKLEAPSTGEVQVFEDEALSIAVETYTKSMKRTVSAWDGTALGNDNMPSNVGKDEIYWSYGARSLADVFADEFVMTIDLTPQIAMGYRANKLFSGSGTSALDYDGLFSVLYQTNKTLPSELVNFANNPLEANPENPNNPDKKMVFSNERGWRLWQEGVGIDEYKALNVSELGLDIDEYVSKIKIVYGGVDVGFYAGEHWTDSTDPHSRTSLKYTDVADLLLLDDAKSDTELYQASDPTLAKTKRNFVVGMSATEPLLQYAPDGSDVVINGYVSAQIARNVVLTDFDADVTETRTFEAMEYPEYKGGFKGFGDDSKLLGNTPALSASPPPQTGDSLAWLQYVLALLFVGLALLTIALIVRKHCNKGNER